MIQTIKDNSKIKHADLILLTAENCKELQEKEEIENGRSYIVKRIPLTRKMKSCYAKRKKTLYNS